MDKKDEKLIRQSLIIREIKGKNLNKVIKEINDKGMNFNDLINNFIAKADMDPHSIADQNCESGKCIAWKLDKQGE